MANFSRLPLQKVYYWSYGHGNGTIRILRLLARMAIRDKFDLAPTVFEILASEVGGVGDFRQKSMFSKSCEAKSAFTAH